MLNVSNTHIYAICYDKSAWCPNIQSAKVFKPKHAKEFIENDGISLRSDHKSDSNQIKNYLCNPKYSSKHFV